jgi:hypothetical protein
MEAIQQRGVLFGRGFHLPSFDEQDQYSLPVFLGTLDPNAATVFARFRHFEIPQPDEEKTTPNIGARSSGFLPLDVAGRNSKAAHTRRSTADCGQRGEAAGAVVKALSVQRWMSGDQ